MVERAGVTRIRTDFGQRPGRTAQERWNSRPGQAGVLSKPFDPLELASQVSAALGW